MIEDPISEERLKQVWGELVDRWREIQDEMYTQWKLQIRCSQGLRTFQDQYMLYGIGREKTSAGWTVTQKSKIVTYARPGESFHNYGLAIDISFVNGPDPFLSKYPNGDKIWKDYGDRCQRHDLVWGGNFCTSLIDRPHCELTLGLTTSDCSILFQQGGVAAVWKKCDNLNNCGREVDSVVIQEGTHS